MEPADVRNPTELQFRWRFLAVEDNLDDMGRVGQFGPNARKD